MQKIVDSGCVLDDFSRKIKTKNTADNEWRLATGDKRVSNGEW